MIEDFKQDAKIRMTKTIDALNVSMGKIRTGRANTSLLDVLSVSYTHLTLPTNREV